jgi:metal-responsive CopG/Arc/MetJ family transcriptional regulator
MTTTINVELQTDLLSLIERYAKQINRRRDEIIADAISLLIVKSVQKKQRFFHEV